MDRVVAERLVGCLECLPPIARQAVGTRKLDRPIPAAGMPIESEALKQG